MKILVTGGAGFIGSGFVRQMLSKHEDYEITVLDSLTYAADKRNLDQVKTGKNFKFIKGDICNYKTVLKALTGVDVVVHFAAESHVDNSIGNSIIFTQTNTLGTHVLLEAARFSNIKRFIHVSTDEVYGDIVKGSFKESSALNPNNPYSASKAGAEMLARSYFKTYNLPVTVVRGNNVFGPFQYPEKIIPKFVTRLIENKKVPLHGSGDQIRTFIYVNDFVNAIECVLKKGLVGEVYNIGTDDEISMLALSKLLVKKLKRNQSYIQTVTDRPFNDKRYSVDLKKIRKLGWKPLHTFESALEETIEWYQNNPLWWKNKNNNNLFNVETK